jgi:hypothetical protein
MILLTNSVENLIKLKKAKQLKFQHIKQLIKKVLTSQKRKIMLNKLICSKIKKSMRDLGGRRFITSYLNSLKLLNLSLQLAMNIAIKKMKKRRNPSKKHQSNSLTKEHRKQIENINENF